MTLRSQKSVNNTDDFSDSSSDGNSTDSEVAGYIFQPQRQRPVLSDRPYVRGSKDPREIEMTKRETTSLVQRRHRLVSTIIIIIKIKKYNIYIAP